MILWDWGGTYDDRDDAGQAIILCSDEGGRY